MTKNTIITASNILQIGYIENEDGLSTNPLLSVSVRIHKMTNEVLSISYTVKCFERKDTPGFHYETFNNYNDAMKCYQSIIDKYDNNI